MRIRRYIALGLAWLSLASCLGASLAWAENRDRSAASFASALTNNSDLFYMYYIARDCTGLANCREISKQLVPTGGLIKFIQRNYVNPGSRRGPDPTKILNPVTIVLDGGNRPMMK